MSDKENIAGVLDLIGWIEDENPFFGWNDLCGLAPCIFNIFLQQYNNGGVEQFVWNYDPIASKVAESFHVIGAKKSAGLIIYYLLDGKFLSLDDIKFGFMDISSIPGFDPVKEVALSILCYGKKHPERFSYSKVRG